MLGTNPLSLARMRLRDFRNYSDEEVLFSSGFNLIIGKNAQGKTNLLEAIYAISTTRLLRSSRDNDAIQFGKESADISAELAESKTELRFVLQRGLTKKAFLNSLPLKRAADLLGRLPSTTISLFDMNLARGEPSDRRMFLDLELSQAYPAYLQHLANFRRSLDHRNALLKTSQSQFVPVEHFETWEEPLAESAAAIRVFRSKFVMELSPKALEVHHALALQEKIEIRYESKDGLMGCNEIASALARERATDVFRGTTSLGPHRDDLVMEIDDQDARKFGSQGQQRTAVIALKFAALELAKERLGVPPILLLDDILSDLDEGRRERLVEWIVQAVGQAVLTCTEASVAGQMIQERAKVFEVSSGKIKVLEKGR